MIQKILFLLVFSVVLAGCSSSPSSTSTKPSDSVNTNDSAMVEESEEDFFAGMYDEEFDFEQEGYPQSGTLLLTEDEDAMLSATVNLTGGSFDAPQPANIVAGTCAEGSIVEYELNDVVNGTSTTALNVDRDTFDSVEDGLSVRVYDPANPRTVTACAELY